MEIESLQAIVEIIMRMTIIDPRFDALIEL